MGRFANKQTRAFLYLLQRGRCALTGAKLPDSFHVDHIDRYSEGGQTCLQNLQAVTPDAHQDKTKRDARPAKGKPNC